MHSVNPLALLMAGILIYCDILPTAGVPTQFNTVTAAISGPARTVAYIRIPECIFSVQESTGSACLPEHQVHDHCDYRQSALNSRCQCDW